MFVCFSLMKKIHWPCAHFAQNLTSAVSKHGSKGNLGDRNCSVAIYSWDMSKQYTSATYNRNFNTSFVLSSQYISMLQFTVSACAFLYVCVCVAKIKIERLFISHFPCESGIECTWVSTCGSVCFCVYERTAFKILFGDCHCGCQRVFVCVCDRKGD